MYNCDACGKTTAPGTTARRIPEGLRVRRYPPRHDAQLSRIRNKKKPVVKDDPGGVGYEWAGMLRVCPACYANYQDGLKEEMFEEVEQKLEEVVAAK